MGRVGREAANDSPFASSNNLALPILVMVVALCIIPSMQSAAAAPSTSNSTAHVGVVLAPTCQPGITCPTLHQLDDYLTGARVLFAPSYETAAETALAHSRIVDWAGICIRTGICTGFSVPQYDDGANGTVSVWYDPHARMYGSLDAWITIVPSPHIYYMINDPGHLVLNTTMPMQPYAQMSSYYLRTDNTCRDVWYSFRDHGGFVPAFYDLLRYVSTDCADDSLRSAIDIQPTIPLTRTPYDFEDSPRWLEAQKWKEIAAASTGCLLEIC